MHLRLFFLAGVAPLAAATSLHAASVSTDAPPGPVTLVNLTNAPPSTPAPPQANAKSAPGAAAPNGANGVNQNGKAMTKAPNTPAALPAPKPNAASAPPAPAATTSPAPATTTAAAPPPASPVAKPSASVFTDYLGELNDTLKLSADEKSAIQAFYTNDGPTLEKILNDASLSPLEQNRQVDDLRTKRDAKIDDLLEDAERQHEFSELESRYRVALTDFAADGGLSPTPATPPAAQPAASPAQATPGTATKTGAP